MIFDPPRYFIYLLAGTELCSVHLIKKNISATMPAYCFPGRKTLGIFNYEKMYGVSVGENSIVSIKTIVMIIVHDIFICKPGNASKLAKLFKEVMAGNNELVDIMTDMTGQYNKVVMVSTYESLTAYEQSWDKYKENTEEMKKMQEKMAGYHDMYLTGSREIFKVW
jgi:hypothetical protein